jgi:hypothetical protein
MKLTKRTDENINTERLPFDDFFAHVLGDLHAQFHTYAVANREEQPLYERHKAAVRLVEKWTAKALKDRPKAISVGDWAANMVATAMLNGYMNGINAAVGAAEGSADDVGLDEIASPSKALH